ncbi:MAG: hypothetical protein ACREBO_11995, partial [Novosphingobium sp.]
YQTLRNRNVRFYRTNRRRFSVEAFDGWNLTDDSFIVRDWDRAALRDLLWVDGREIENYE